MTTPDSTHAMAARQTPSQTVGPFYGYALPYAGGPELLPPHAPETIRLHGTVFDGDSEPVPDALIEIWQPDAAGAVVAERGSLHRDGYTFTGFGRAAVDGSGHYSFTTVKPGSARAGSAPYILVTVFARGLLHHLFTRAYFSDEPAANGADPFLAGVDAARVATLVAERDGAAQYRFDIRLQGENETVFIDYPLSRRA
ncbi:protocatechuate 3,4-dioxygenase subunit alpha [Lacisediminihabitans profunda]|nr:protocatechuate 3,4-dioxygenase subunit alpha [Lacisediminihabitans profunda]